MKSRTRYGDAAKSNARINTRAQYGNSAHVGDGCRQQRCIKNCGQTVADKDFWQSIGSRHRPIQRYHRLPLRPTVSPQYMPYVQTDNRQKTLSYPRLELTVG